jgi:hypothetical protein
MAAFANPLNINPGGSGGNQSGWQGMFGNSGNWSMFNNNMPMPSGNSNQFFNMMPGMANPGQAPAPGNNPYQVQPYGQSQSTNAPNNRPNAGPSTNEGHGIIATGLQFPGLATNWANYLQSQIGQGMTPFDLSTVLPTGGSTAPGQLTAGLNPLMQQLMQFFQGGQSNAPGMNSLATIANQGISALPEWQSMIGAQQQNIQQNEANLKEQFAGTGNIAGSGFGNAISNYSTQTAANQNALLGQLQQQNILQGQIPVAEMLQQQGQNFAGGLQQLDQSAINAMYQEFQRIAPQNNPMNQFMNQLASLYPPTTRTPTSAESVMSWLSSLGGMFGTSGTTSGGTNWSVGG